MWRSHYHQQRIFQQCFGGDLNRKGISTDGQRESVSTASADGASLILDLLLITVVVLGLLIPFITMTSLAIVIMSADFLFMSIVAVESIPMAVVAIPVSVRYAIVNEGTVFIFAELADQLRLQCWKSKTRNP